MIPVRMGIHTGTPLLTDEGYVGDGRAQGCADRGRRPRRPDPRLVRERRAAGERRAPRSRRAPAQGPLFARADLPARRERVSAAEDALPRRICPIPATPFLGRERELASSARSSPRRTSASSRCSGPGGTGKTRLALQAVAGAAERYPDGVFWVPLAPLRDPASCSRARRRRSARATGSPSIWPTSELLLLLDNFEHLDGRGRRARRRCSQLPEPAASSSRAGSSSSCRAEQSYPVAPLDRRTACSCSWHARGRRPGSSPTGRCRALCARLDNLPLALELAAARVRILSPQQLLERLAQRLDLLKGGRDADPRQQTLRATIEWSYDLLDDGRAAAVRAAGASSAAAARSRLRKRSPGPIWTRWSRSSTRACSGTRASASGCSRRFVPSPESVSAASSEEAELASASCGLRRSISWRRSGGTWRRAATRWSGRRSRRRARQPAGGARVGARFAGRRGSAASCRRRLAVLAAARLLPERPSSGSRSRSSADRPPATARMDVLRGASVRAAATRDYDRSDAYVAEWRSLAEQTGDEGELLAQ